MYAIIYSRRLIRVPTKDAQFAALQFLFHFSSRSSSSDATFTISYLTNSCGLSLKNAIPASKKLLIKSRENSDAVLELFTAYGLTKAQISKLIAKWPRFLQSSAEKTLSPKLEFFKSIGVPPAVLSQTVSEYPFLLRRSFGNYYIPWYNYLKSIVESDKNVVAVFSRSPMAFTHGWPTRVPANIQILRERGVSESSIASLLVSKPSVLIIRRERLYKYVDRAAEMGFVASKAAFVGALQMFGKMSESTLKQKMDVYRRCGWSESELTSAFLRYPSCMKLSQKKIRANMDFLVNELGFNPGDIAWNPVILDYSAERRMRPRWIVARILKAKGLMRKSAGITKVFMMSEADFLKRYIIEHEGEIPQLLDIYRGKVSFVGIGSDGNVISD